MGFFSFVICSFSTGVALILAELIILIAIVKVERLRTLAWQKLFVFRGLVLVAIAVQLALLIHAICFASEEPVAEIKRITALARLWAKGNPAYEGDVPKGIIELSEFKNEDGSSYVLIQGRITDVAPKDSFHGFHVHDVANFSVGCDSTGGHYNPTKRDHGDIYLPETHRHVGDLGNVYADSHGLINVDLKDSIIRLSGDSVSNIVGRPLVLHEDKDDLGLGQLPSSKLNGNSGKRLLCGVVNLN